MSLIEKIEQVDVELFLFLNGKHNAFFDVLMDWVSWKFTWIPFYLFLLILIWKKNNWKSFLLIILFIAILIAICDQASTHLFKEVFERYRPCHNLEIGSMIHLTGNCGGQYGFLSSHAANTFALASFIGLLFKKRKWLFGLLLWALLIAYSRVYLGVHYPADVVAGAMLGVVAGYSVFRVYKFIR